MSLLAAGRPLPQDLELDRDRAMGMLDQVSGEIQKNFYDPKLKGLDWKALVEQTRQRIKAAKSPAEMFIAIYVLTEKLDDSHTAFIPPGRVGRVRFGFEAKPYGEEVRIHKITKRGAAERAGLQVGDRIVSINGYPIDRWSLHKLMLYFRVLRPVMEMEIEYQRGSETKKVRFEGDYKAGKQELDFSTFGTDVYDLIREGQLEKELARYQMLEGDIGWLGIPFFTDDRGDWRDLIGKVEKSRALIIDLRGNPGGAVSGLLYFSGFFEPGETTMQETVRRDKTEPMKIKPQKPLLGAPLFILVDSESASASEIFARYFQRTGRATVIGDLTSGSVSVGRLSPKQMGVDTVIFYSVYVTVAKVVLPGGEELEKRGVTPDRVCIPTADDMRANRDPCRALAISLARQKLGLAESAK